MQEKSQFSAIFSYKGQEMCGWLEAKEVLGVLGSDGEDFFDWTVEGLGEAFGDVEDETALIAFAAMRNRRHVGSVGLEH